MNAPVPPRDRVTVPEAFNRYQRSIAGMINARRSLDLAMAEKMRAEDAWARAADEQRVAQIELEDVIRGGIERSAGLPREFPP